MRGFLVDFGAETVVVEATAIFFVGTLESSCSLGGSVNSILTSRLISGLGSFFALASLSFSSLALRFSCVLRCLRKSPPPRKCLSHWGHL